MVRIFRKGVKMDYNLTDEQKNVTLEYVLNQPVKAVENFDLIKRAIIRKSRKS